MIHNQKSQTSRDYSPPAVGVRGFGGVTDWHFALRFLGMVGVRCENTGCFGGHREVI
jgi:hypothetical protein